MNILDILVGRLGLGISPSQGLWYTGERNTHWCLERDSIPWSQFLSGASHTLRRPRGY